MGGDTRSLCCVPEGRVEGGGGNRRTKVGQVGPLALTVWDITLVFSTYGCSLAEPSGP